MILFIKLHFDAIFGDKMANSCHLVEIFNGENYDSFCLLLCDTW